MAADQNFDEPTLRAFLERMPGLDLVRVREVGLARAADPHVLEWAAAEGRVLLTHDRDTMPGHAYERVRAGLPMPGVVEVPSDPAIGPTVDDLEVLVACSLKGELEGQVVYLPL